MNCLFKHCCVQFLGGTWHQGWIIPAEAYPKANKKSKYYLLCNDGIVRGFSPTTVRQIKKHKGE